MITVAVIGCGYWGPNLVRNLWALDDCSVQTVCDKSRERLQHMQRLYHGIEITTDVNDVLADSRIDAVVIATPVQTHHELGKRSLKAGKHTFIEKPLTASVPEARELVETAHLAKRLLMVGHTFVYSPAVRKVKEIIDSGSIGEVLCISARRLNLGLFQTHINVAWDLGPHDLSIVLYLLGSRPVAVSCQGVDHFHTGIEDVTTMNLLFPGGQFVSIQNSWLDPRKTREMTIVGTKKMIVYDDTEPLEKLRVYDKHVSVPPHYDTYAEFQFSYHYGDVSIPYIRLVEPLKTETQHFIDCINGLAPCLSSGVEGMRVVEVLERAGESLRADGALLALGRESATKDSLYV
ncbi:MAG: Gfo/Idh/MocA family protein [Rhodothermales bacterium]